MTVMSPSELYQDPVNRERLEGWNWAEGTNTDAMIVAADAVIGESDIVGYLDDLYDADMDMWFDAKRGITNLPGDAILENYGEEVLVWAAANAGMESIFERMSSTLEDSLGYDMDLFEKARRWCLKQGTSKGKDVMLQYAVMDTLMSDALDKIDLASTIKQSAKDGIEISDKRAADYALIPLRSEASTFSGREKDWSKEVEPGIAYDIWMDAPTGFALTYKGKPNAIIALVASGPDELIIHQLQGVQANRVNPDKRFTEEYIIGSISSRGLAPLDWQKLLINITGELAANMGMKSLAIQGGENNKWRKAMHDETEPHLTKETAAKAYDAPAERLGFTRDAKGNWHKAL